jgi:hypothetical protein
VLLLLACSNTWPPGLPEREIQAREEYFATPITLSGQVLSATGELVPGVQLEVQGLEESTSDSGSFSMSPLLRQNALLTVSAPGFNTEVIGVQLAVAQDRGSVALDTILLEPKRSGYARLFFAGDVSYGRRFVDTLETTPLTEVPEDDPNALIQASDPEPDTRGTFDWIEPLYRYADYRSLNLETPVTLTPDTPHPTKDYVFFTLPGSVDAVAEEGFDYVSLGNNHLYDYLEQGVVDTLEWVNQSGLAHSGGGLTQEEAFGPHNFSLAGKPYSMLAMTSVNGFQHDLGYVATPNQAGAADLTDTEGVRAALRAVTSSGRSPILQLHTGKEYTERPSDYTQTRFDLGVDEGAALIIGHHPHFVQGFDVDDGVLVVHSLGNFIFDQDRFETMLGLVLQVDLSGTEWRPATGTPIYLEDYRPRVLVGDLGQWMLRRMAWSSEGYGSEAVPHNGRIKVSGTSSDWRLQERTIELSVVISDSGVALVDLRQLMESTESLAFARAQGFGLSAKPGRDLLLFGDFEDVDVDEDDFEVTRWLTGSDARFACVSGAYRGAAGLCMTRDGYNSQDVVVTFRNRIRVEGDSVALPKKDLSVLTYAQGEGGCRFDVEVTYRASEGDRSFGEFRAISTVPGEEWAAYWTDLDMPDDTDDPLDREANPRAMKVQLRTLPPNRGQGWVSVDDVALISWQDSQDLSTGFAIETPHPYDYLRVEGEPGTYALTLNAERRVWTGGVSK